MPKILYAGLATTGLVAAFALIVAPSLAAGNHPPTAMPAFQVAEPPAPPASAQTFDPSVFDPTRAPELRIGRTGGTAADAPAMHVASPNAARAYRSNRDD